jgi:peptidoglycan/xylan/chitin deacetylase (PgdA/CDA1 family)
MAGPSTKIVFLMYHELALAGRNLCQSDPGYVRYILPIEAFRSQMEWLKQAGYRALSVGEALHYPAGKSVCITFDDGCETDLIAAAPVLREFGFHASFYVTAGFLDTPGYLSTDQLRQLDAEGFEIGCHSMTHPYLPDLTDAELRHEIGDAKLRIEQALGHSIDHFSCPGGRYDSRTMMAASSAKFRTVANSNFHANSEKTKRFHLGRVAILRDVSLEEFGLLCRGQGLWKKRLQHRTRLGVQLVFGNRAYDQLRAVLLRESRH